MARLLTEYRWVRSAVVLIAAGMFLASGAPAGAVPFYAAGYGGDCALDIQRDADRDGYYLRIRYGSAAAPDIAVQRRGRLLRIQARQDADRGGGGCYTRFYKSLALPRDADAGRMERHEYAGGVLIVIPRRQPWGWR